jgi:excisionase family DNA binding protein
MKTVFTTGEAAKICKVSQQTIIRCFDNGQLKGFRVPGSRFRRIPREMLYKFMKDNGIPTDALESGKRKVLLVDDDVELVELMTKVLEEDGRFEVRIATTVSHNVAPRIGSRVTLLTDRQEAEIRDDNGRRASLGKALGGPPLVRLASRQ